MPYNLRPRRTTAVKRPDGTALPPRKRLRKSSQIPIEAGDILRKPVPRPLGLFESLFNAYPVVQAIVRYISTPDVMSLCITTPHLWRLLAGNRAFHTFSNHRNCIDLDKPVETLKEYRSRNTFEKFFTRDVDLLRLWCRYLEIGTLTHLVLDGTEVTFALLFIVAAKANITLLSLKYCRKLSLEAINALLDCPPRNKYLFTGNPLVSDILQPKSVGDLLGDLRTLRV